MEDDICRITQEHVYNPHEDHKPVLDTYDDEPDDLIMKEAMWIITESQIEALKEISRLLTKIYGCDVYGLVDIVKEIQEGT